MVMDCGSRYREMSSNKSVHRSLLIVKMFLAICKKFWSYSELDSHDDDSWNF